MSLEVGESFPEISFGMGLESADDGVVHLREPLEETREVKDAFAGGEMFVGMAVIVVEVDFMQIRSEDIQPVVEGNVGENLEVAGVETEAEGRGESHETGDITLRSGGVCAQAHRR